MLTRRTLLRLLGPAAVMPALPRIVGAHAQGPRVATEPPAPMASLHLTGATPLAVIPRDFTGLGYEESMVARAGLLAASDQSYVQLAKNLGPGVLRAGGIVADFTEYIPDGTASFEPRRTVITRANLQQLRDFLDAVDWRALWSVNFGRGTVAQAIAEARDVAAILGPRLLAIELGNEVENYGHGEAPLRPSPYTFEQYRAEYTQWRQAMVAAVPGLRFAAPDTAASVAWLERLAADAHGDVQLLTTHYYRGDQHTGTRDQLLGPDAGLVANLERLRQASRASGIPWRMCEINSFFGGGRPGLSDTLAGTLWTLDIMLLLAQYGCAGVNLETGFNQLGFLSSYSPVRNDDGGNVSPGAPYLGMLAFALATAEAPEVLPAVLDTGGRNITAYVLGQGGRPRSVVVINKTADQSLRMPLEPLGLRRASVLRLRGRSLDSGAAITLGGVGVDASGRWQKAAKELLRGDLLVEPRSAVLVLGAT